MSENGVGEKPGAEVAHFKLTSALDAITTMVVVDEPCYMLTELDLPIEGSKAKHRFQVLRIVRNDGLVTAYVDLGLASKYAADQFVTMGGQVENGKGRAWHTVGELQEIAEHFRNEKPYREIAPSDLQGGWIKHNERKVRQSKHQSSFGYKGELIRS